MTNEQFNDLLADWLGDELSPDDRTAFERELAANPLRRAEAQRLREAQDLVRALARPQPQLRQPHPAMLRVVAAALRYAAVIALAFAGGYMARGPDAPATQPAAPRVVEQPPARAPGDSRLADRYAAALRKFPDSPTLSHSLLMLARR